MSVSRRRWLAVLTGALLAFTIAYFTAAILSLVVRVPMEVFLWGGLILLLAWAGQDRIAERWMACR